MSYHKIKEFARKMRKNPTKAEAFFWKQIRNRKFLGKKVNRQYIIRHEVIRDKERFYIADFYCAEHRLVIELDGSIHRQQVDYDRLREEKLVQMGFRLVRFSNEEVLEDWQGVEEKLIEFFSQA